MALPASPNLISMDLIRAELGVPSQAPFNINDARLGTYAVLNPYSPTLPPSSGTVSLGSWHSYCHTCTTLYSFTVYQAGPADPGPRHFLSAALACTGTRSYPITVYSSSSTLGVGSTLYYLNGTQYVAYTINDAGGGEQIWLYDGTGSKPFRLTNTASNTIDAVDTCAPPSTAYTVRLDYSTPNICTASMYTVYTSGAWGVGVTVYNDSGLTSPVTTYNHIVNVADGIIYDIDNATGVIQLDTGLAC